MKRRDAYDRFATVAATVLYWGLIAIGVIMISIAVAAFFCGMITITLKEFL